MNSPISKKKVLYVITKSNFGGAQRYVFELAVAMSNLGYEVAVACGGKGELVERLHNANITTYSIDDFQRDINLFKEIKSVFTLIKIIRQYQPDIIHLNSAKAGGLGAVVARFLGVSHIVFTAHGWPFLESRGRLWRLLAWGGSFLTGLLSHQIITVSQNDYKQTSSMPLIKNKCTTIHTAVQDFPLFSRIEAREKLLPKNISLSHSSHIWLGTIAELSHNKNHTLAIDAIADFNDTHANKIFYFIIGSGDQRENLKEQVDLRGQNEYIYFCDYLTEARQYLLAFDFFILPSKKEGLPYALLEAGLAQVPCIASKIGGIPEVITDKYSGILTNPNNHTSIVDALNYLIINPDKRTTYADNLRNHIKDNFNLEKMIKATDKIYSTNQREVDSSSKP